MKRYEMYEELLDTIHSLTAEIIEILANTDVLTEEELQELAGLYDERGIKLNEFNTWYKTPEAVAETKNSALWSEKFLKLRELDKLHGEILQQRTLDTKEALRKIMHNRSVFLYTQK